MSWVHISCTIKKKRASVNMESNQPMSHCHFKERMLLYPRTAKLSEGILVSLRSSVCPFARPSRNPCPLCSAYSSGCTHFIVFWQVFKMCNFDFVLFWLGIWCESLIWAIMAQRGISKLRRSSYSSFVLLWYRAGNFVPWNSLLFFISIWKRQIYSL